MRVTHRIIAAVALAVVVAAPLAGQGPPPDTKLPPLPPPNLPLVTSQDLLDGFKNPSRWLTFSGNYTGQRHSPLKQITPENVRRLTAQWTFQAEGMAIGRGFVHCIKRSCDLRIGHELGGLYRHLDRGIAYGHDVDLIGSQHRLHAEATDPADAEKANAGLTHRSPEL